MQSLVLCEIICLHLADKTLEARVPQTLEHLLGVFAVGEGADLDTIELIGGRLLRIGGNLDVYGSVP